MVDGGPVDVHTLSTPDVPKVKVRPTLPRGTRVDVGVSPRPGTALREDDGLEPPGRVVGDDDVTDDVVLAELPRVTTHVREQPDHRVEPLSHGAVK